MTDLIKWHEQEIARQKHHIERNRVVFMVVMVAFVVAGIGYGLGRWPDVVARIIAGWL